LRGADLLAALPDPPSAAECANAGWHAVAGVDFSAVSADSRRMQPGSLFVALPGTRVDGRRFIADAVARGAAAVLAAPDTIWPPAAPVRPLLRDPEPRRRLAQIAAILAGPQPRVVAAVTGTNGKTSTVVFLRQLWILAGWPAAALGTLGVEAPGFASGPGLTTPDPETLAATLASLAARGVTHAALEASSHGLDQFRLDGVRLAAGAFTNLTRDHLDYHGDMDRYRAAKLRLFAELLPAGAPAFAFSGLEPASLAALGEIAAHRGLRFATVGPEGSLLRLVSARPLAWGQELVIDAAGRRRTVELGLVGLFQAENALLAAALAEATGVADACASLPHLVGVRGRLEIAGRLPNGATVVVDFAHTPDALERLLRALRPHCAGRLHIVFGAGGDRDRGKRPLMGEVAARLADVVVVTDDNPRNEDPAAIRAAVLAGCPAGRDGGDRRTAIASALAELRPGDLLVIAGKGHEQGQTIGGVTLPFDDVSEVRRLLGLVTPEGSAP
jgi:UDP-N-acetylmuramoyl-L-alanyl-D-glutamate--2,6-diaminopimelate ligase